VTAQKYPEQPSGVDWPTKDWESSDLERVDGHADPGGEIAAALSALFDHGVEPPDGRGLSLALVAVHRGRIVIERYGRQPANLFHAERDITETTPLISWSMAKSITHAMVGMLVADGSIDLDSRVLVPEWQHDGRADITWVDLLRMRDGLDFVEDYVADAAGNSRSDVIDMLFGEGSRDVFAYARNRPTSNPPGDVWSYSSGTTNIICGLISRILGGRDEVEDFLHRRLFAPLGMSSATATFDEAGTFIGSSYVHATARDFARFGYLYLRGGLFADRRILDENWVRRAHAQHAIDSDNGHGYGEHWWTWNADPKTLAALGYEGQRTIVVPERDLVLVHLGKWEASTQRFLDSTLTRIVEAVPVGALD
jgi:CubicO group peptidase (beta-lactamase class C family)